MTAPPLRIVCLGGISVAPSSNRATRLLSQPRRAALLAYVASAHPGQFRTRDQLTGMFWPEADARRARSALRNALYFLRSSGHRDMFTTIGDSIGLNPNVLGSDVGDFLAALRERRPSDAVSLYRGPLLDGFHVSGAPEFEHWLDRERSSLRNLAVAAAWEAAAVEERRGNAVTASMLGRAAASWSIDVEAATRALVEMLLRLGDRAAALAAYEEGVRRLEREFGVDPGPETRAVGEAARRPSLAPGALALPAASRARPSLAVLPFSALQAQGEAPVIARGLTEDLTTELARISGIKVISRTSADVAREAGVTLPELSRRLGVDCVVEGSVRVEEGLVRVTVQLIDARGDDHLWTGAFECDPSDVFGLQVPVAREVARASRARLLTSEAVRLAGGRGVPAAAAQHYWRGRYAWSRRSHESVQAAVDEFQAALREAPGFPEAHAALANAWMVLAMAGATPFSTCAREARGHAGTALSLDPGLGEALAVIGTLDALHDLDWAGAENTLRRSLDVSPGSATVHQWFADFLSARGRSEEARERMSTAADLDPLSPVIRADSGWIEFAAGNVDGAVDLYRDALRLDEGFWRSHFDLGLVMGSAGQADGAREHLLRGWELGGFGTTEAEVAALRAVGGSGLEPLLRTKIAQLTGGPRQPGMAIEVALLAALARDLATAFDWLRAAGEDRTLGFAARFAPVFRECQQDPRWTSVVGTALD